MSIGGFNGTDPAPTLAEFKRLVAEHKIHYFVGANARQLRRRLRRRDRPSAAGSAAHFRSETVGGDTVYNLTDPR